MTAPLHGQFKTPGGKLIAVDFEIIDNCLHDVRVHGDFFLDPEDAFVAITSSLEGAPINASDADLTERVSAAIPPGTEWMGASPEALVTAVRRALESQHQTGGGDRGWS